MQKINQIIKKIKNRSIYYSHLILKKPYFGPVHIAYGCSRECGEMLKLIPPQQEEIRVLELGCWVGGSTLKFAKGLDKYHKNNGKITCIDPWIPYFDIKENKNPNYQWMNNVMSDGIIFKLFKHNIKSAGIEKYVEIKRGKSSEFLPNLNQKSFHIVHVDADHIYPSVSYDIQNAHVLCIEGGILCGDDLEMQYDDVDQDFLEKNISQDYILDPKTQKKYHPGVTKAVYEFFKRKVSTNKNFWAVQKKGNTWVDVDFSKIQLE